MITTPSDYSDLMQRADDLAAEIEASNARLRGESPATAEPVPQLQTKPAVPSPADPAVVVRTALEKVRSRRFAAGQDAADFESALAESGIYSEEYKREQAENFRGTQAREAEAVAALEWRRLEALEADLAIQHAEAERHVDQRVDHARVAGMTRDLEARLAVGPSAPGATGNADRVALAEKMIAEAEASGDPDRLRATRHALAQIVNDLARTSDQGDSGIRGRDLRRRLHSLEGLERGEADQIAQVRKAVAVKKIELAQEIELLEQTTTGVKREMFQPVTPWDKSVFGKTDEAIITTYKTA